MKRFLKDVLVLLSLSGSALAAVNSTSVPFPFAVIGNKAVAATSRHEFDMACEKFLATARVADPHFFMQHCVGGTGVQCEGWLTALVRHFSKGTLSKASKKDWCSTVFNEVSAEQHAQQQETSASKPAVTKADEKPIVGLAHSQASHASRVSYNIEVRGQNCGLQAHGSYVSTTDDAAACKAKCTADKACLAYTTYDSDCALKCLHYSHGCDKKHQTSTQCTGDIVSYSKVTTSVDSLPANNHHQPSLQNVTSKNATNAKTSPTPSTGKSTTLHNQSQTNPANAVVNAVVNTSKKVTAVAPLHAKSISSHNQQSMQKADTHVQSNSPPANKAPKPPAKESIEKVKTTTTTTAVSKPSHNMATKALAKKAAKDTAADSGIVLPTADTGVKDVRSSKHKSWKEFLPKTNNKVQDVTKAIAPSTNSSNNKNCACVHRHGKQVCHCLGEKDTKAGSVTHSQ